MADLVRLAKEGKYLLGPRSNIPAAGLLLECRPWPCVAAMTLLTKVKHELKEAPWL